MLRKHGDVQTMEQLNWILQSATVLPDLDHQVSEPETGQHCWRPLIKLFMPQTDIFTSRGTEVSAIRAIYQISGPFQTYGTSNLWGYLSHLPFSFRQLLWLLPVLFEKLSYDASTRYTLELTLNWGYWYIAFRHLFLPFPFPGITVVRLLLSSH